MFCGTRSVRTWPCAAHPDDAGHAEVFNAEVPQIWQWDDHEVTNNWSDSKNLTADPRYTEKNVPLLAALGLNVGDGVTPQGLPQWEAVANGESGGPKGRELEFAELFKHLKRERVRNVVWLTADVHYCAAHFYDPARAAFHDFDGFWEFVAGPLNAGTFGPNGLDGTFGPQVVFSKTPPPGMSNLSPFSGLQFFGEVNIDSSSRTLTVDLRDLEGRSVFSRTLHP
jgi:alkaline phosphatase D